MNTAMDPLQIKKLLKTGCFPDNQAGPILKETHISWVILTSKYAYKIKKPLHYSFLDFSTLEKRKYFCEREVELNRRLAAKMYLKTIPIFMNGDTISLNNEDGKIIDYAVLMNRMDSSKEMKYMLQRNEVSTGSIEKLAKQLAAFHESASIVKNKFDIHDFQQKYNDIKTVNSYISEHYKDIYSNIIIDVIKKSDEFLNTQRSYFQYRSTHGFIRDIHGDLHSGNIFLYEEPVIFDCIEFNDDFRQIDVLDEIAFFCMDMEANNRNDLSKLFYENYLVYSKMNETQESRMLFNYYKSYRANVRAKINTLNAMQSSDEELDLKKREDIERYFKLLKSYLENDFK